MTDTGNPTALDLLRRTESLLSALHGSVARHDNLAANLGCAGCELRDAVSQALAAVPSAAETTNRAALRAAECSAQNRNYESGPRLCIRAAQHGGDHIDERGFHWSDTVAVYPVSDGTFRRGTDVRALLRRVAAEEQPAEPPMFGSPDCTCIPFTRQGGKPRYCGPTDTVDMISGWEIGRDCPHHKPAVGEQPETQEADRG